MVCLGNSEDMKKPISKSKAKKKAWAVFSKYIRQSYADKMGLANCFTCGVRLPITQLQAGHGIGGRNNAVLFKEELVRPQCVGCNLYGRGKYSVFTENLIRELGPEKYFELVKESNQIVQYKVSDYLEIEAKYKAKLGGDF